MNQKIKHILQLVTGIGLLLALTAILRTTTPPGSAGVVVRHNLDTGFDASPLFYSDFDDFSQYEIK